MVSAATLLEISSGLACMNILSLQSHVAYGHVGNSAAVAEALSKAASAIFGILKRTMDAGAEEMALIEAQEELIDPSANFIVESL